jgi:hypothetical protein
MSLTRQASLCCVEQPAKSNKQIHKMNFFLGAMSNRDDDLLQGGKLATVTNFL